jgi:hypothetical protein
MVFAANKALCQSKRITQRLDVEQFLLERGCCTGKRRIHRESFILCSEQKNPRLTNAIFIKCCLCAVSDLFRVNLRSVYRHNTVTYEALVELGSKNLCKASPFVGKQEHFFETKMVRRHQN